MRYLSRILSRSAGFVSIRRLSESRPSASAGASRNRRASPSGSAVSTTRPLGKTKRIECSV